MCKKNQNGLRQVSFPKISHTSAILPCHHHLLGNRTDYAYRSINQRSWYFRLTLDNLGGVCYRSPLNLGTTSQNTLEVDNVALKRTELYLTGRDDIVQLTDFSADLQLKGSARLGSGADLVDRLHVVISDSRSVNAVRRLHATTLPCIYYRWLRQHII